MNFTGKPQLFARKIEQNPFKVVKESGKDIKT
jgi:hypothetical protein